LVAGLPASIRASGRDVMSESTPRGILDVTRRRNGDTREF
jgi:hypothetical protein